MASRTNSDKIADLSEKQAMLTSLVEVQKQVGIEIAEELNQLARRAEDEFKGIAQKQAVAEEKIRTLERQFEKHSDRTWQLIPILISLLAIVVSLIVAFLKR